MKLNEIEVILFDLGNVVIEIDFQGSSRNGKNFLEKTILM